jgi:hypothetical protein
MLEQILKEINRTEQKLIVKLNNKLKKINKEPSYLIDKSISHAKFKYKENLIIINDKNIFKSLVHEQLHAILIYNNNFPTINKISTLSKKYNLQRLNGLIVDIYNDFHHFVFFMEFNKITLGKNFIINQELLLNPKFKFDFLTQKYINKKNYHEKIKVFYNSFFIPLKYKVLMNEGVLDWNNESLIKLDSELFQILTKLFDLKIEFSLQENIDYHQDVINSFSVFFENLNKYIFKA